MLSFCICRCKIKFWPPPPIEYRPGVNIQWIFRWIVTLLSCWILITLLNSDTFLSRNSTGRRYVDGSEFHVELWPRVKIPRWIMTRVRITHWIVIPIPGHNLTWDHNSTWNHDPGSQFNVKSWPGSLFNVESWPRVTIQHWVMTRGHNTTWNYDPGSTFHVELWPGS